MIGDVGQLDRDGDLALGGAIEAAVGVPALEMAADIVAQDLHRLGDRPDRDAKRGGSLGEQGVEPLEQPAGLGIALAQRRAGIARVGIDRIAELGPDRRALRRRRFAERDDRIAFGGAERGRDRRR